MSHLNDSDRVISSNRVRLGDLSLEFLDYFITQSPDLRKVLIDIIDIKVMPCSRFSTGFQIKTT